MGAFERFLDRNLVNSKVPSLEEGGDGDNADVGDVGAVLAESSEPIIAVRMWVVASVALESVPEVLRLSVVETSVDGLESEMPKLAALLIKLSRYDSKLCVDSCKTLLIYSASLSSGSRFPAGL